VTPGLGPFAVREFAAWAEEAGLPDFDLETWPEAAAIEAAEEGEAAAVLTLTDAPEGWFAAPIGVEGMAIIVNSENRVRALDLADLQEIFSGRAATWEPFGGTDQAILPVVPLSGDGLRVAFERQVMRGIPVSGGSRLAPNPEAARTIVGESPGAIGLIPFSATDESTRLVRIDGVLPGDDSLRAGRYPLTLPILILAPEEPGGDVRDWIVWLQAKADS
jgi:ABC-type phosphate transport system substrate-binding protein